MVSVEAFSELLQILYSAPLDALQWERFLTLLTRYTGGRFGVFICADSGRGLSVHAFGGDVDAESIQRYNERYGRSDPYRVGVIRRSGSCILEGDELVPAETFLKTELYREGLQPLGVRYLTVIPLTVSVRCLEAVSIWRPPENASMTEDTVRLLELLLPHLRQALQVHRMLNVTKQLLAGTEALADASATAAFLLTRSGQVVHTNAAARSLLQQEADTLAMHEGALTARQAPFRTRWKEFLLSATLSSLASLQDQQVRAFALPRNSGKQPLQLIASPLPLDDARGNGAELLLLISDPDKPASFPDNVLHDLYSLTPAETDVANGLLMGYSAEEIACLRRCRLGTVRNQIKSILGKTGAARQSDLVRLLMTLPTRNAAK